MFRPYLLRRRYDPDADRYFMAMPTPPVALQRDLVSQFMSGAKYDGWWNYVDGGNIFALGTLAHGLIDFKLPSRVATVYSAPTFTFSANRGVTGSASTDTVNLPDSINTGFDPTAAGDNMSQDSMLFGIYSHTSAAVSRIDAGISTATADIFIQCRVAGAPDQFIGRPFTTANVNLMDSSDGSGLFLINRTAPNSLFAQRNSTQGSTLTNASGGMTAGSTLRYLQVQSNQGNTRQLSFGIYGGGISSALALLLNTRVQTLITGLRVL